MWGILQAARHQLTCKGNLLEPNGSFLSTYIDPRAAGYLHWATDKILFFDFSTTVLISGLRRGPHRILIVFNPQCDDCSRSPKHHHHAPAVRVRPAAGTGGPRRQLLMNHIRILPTSRNRHRNQNQHGKSLSLIHISEPTRPY